MDNTTSILFSAGTGSRNRPISLTSMTSMLSKGLMRVMGIPLSELQIRVLHDVGIDDFCFLTKYLDNHVPLGDRFGDGSRFGVRIRYSSTLERMLDNGSADGLLRHITASNKKSDNSVCLANDNIYEANWRDVLDFHRKNGSLITILATLCNPRDTIKDYGLLKVGSDGRVYDIFEKPKSEDELVRILGLSGSKHLDDYPPVWINTAGYIVDNAGLERLAEEPWVKSGRASYFDIASHLIKGCIDSGLPVDAYLIDNWSDLGNNHKFLASVERALSGEFPSVNEVLRAKGYLHFEKSNVWIHPESYNRSRNGDKSLKEMMDSHEVEIGPNVFIGESVHVCPGAKIRYSSIEKDSYVGNSFVSHSVLFPGCLVWNSCSDGHVRVERSILGFEVVVAYSESLADTHTAITDSFIGPSVHVPEGYQISRSVVYPGYDLSANSPHGPVIVNETLKPSIHSVNKALMA